MKFAESGSGHSFPRDTSVSDQSKRIFDSVSARWGAGEGREATPRTVQGKTRLIMMNEETAVKRIQMTAIIGIRPILANCTDPSMQPTLSTENAFLLIVKSNWNDWFRFPQCFVRGPPPAARPFRPQQKLLGFFSNYCKVSSCLTSPLRIELLRRQYFKILIRSIYVNLLVVRLGSSIFRGHRRQSPTPPPARGTPRRALNYPRTRACDPSGLKYPTEIAHRSSFQFCCGLHKLIFVRPIRVVRGPAVRLRSVR